MMVYKVVTNESYWVDKYSPVVVFFIWCCIGYIAGSNFWVWNHKVCRPFNKSYSLWLALKISTIWTKYSQSYHKVSCFVAFYENRFFLHPFMTNWRKLDATFENKLLIFRNKVQRDGSYSKNSHTRSILIKINFCFNLSTYT